MHVNLETIQQYISEANAKIELLKMDITTYQKRMNSAHKEISTMNFLIDQYVKALELLENEPSKENQR
jgi:hypothetical protein